MGENLFLTLSHEGSTNQTHTEFLLTPVRMAKLVLVRWWPGRHRDGRSVGTDAWSEACKPELESWIPTRWKGMTDSCKLASDHHMHSHMHRYIKINKSATKIFFL